MHDHLVCVDEASREIAIYRMIEGKRVLLTSISFDRAKGMGLDGFAEMLGENLVLDSRVLRALFSL